VSNADDGILKKLSPARYSNPGDATGMRSESNGAACVARAARMCLNIRGRHLFQEDCCGDE